MAMPSRSHVKALYVGADTFRNPFGGNVASERCVFHFQPQMTRLKSIVAFVLFTTLCHLLALAASQEGKDPARDAQLEREKRWDEWKKLGKAGALVGEKVIDLLINPPHSTFLIEALSISADRLLEVESEEYQAIKELTLIVECQHQTSMRRFNEMQRPVKELIIDNDYKEHVELYLTALHGAYMEYADSIGKSKVLQKIKMDELGEECKFYKPKQSLRKLQNTLQHCFMSTPISDNSSLRCRRCAAEEGQTLEVTSNAITLFHDENLLTEQIRRKKYTENLCKLERAYRVQENQSASLSNTVDAIMSDVEQLIVFSRICSAVVHKDNALKREDAFNTAAAVGAKIISKMVEWAENRFESAWPDEMRSKAKEIIEGFTEEYKIPQGDLQKLSDRIRTAMQSMVSRKYAHQVMLISHNYAKPIFNVNYSYSDNFKYNFAVRDVKKVSAIVTRHIYSLAECHDRDQGECDIYVCMDILNYRTQTPENMSFDFTHYEKRYHTNVFAMVHLYGEQKNCLGHTAFFTRSLERYEEKCRNAARWMLSHPRAFHDTSVGSMPFNGNPPYSHTYCAWLFEFM